ncbi:T-lymphocyte activation antigen CD86-like [Hypanus sabinus]|uniref:T-lymphocyte activation antigen CD86-like n=1 Tax=Hypanus sabinus TaxID=79690 RepID=UPI0028C49DD6|nr:T-lymphocyte activation antigen CD86-like [Hypanus sabinus]
MLVLLLTVCLTIVTTTGSEPTQVTGAFGGEVVLPCRGSARRDRVYWQKSRTQSAREKVVNALCLPSEPCSDRVDPAYAGRSSFPANGTGGDFSLLLRELTVADEGLYECILLNRAVVSQRIVNLSIEAKYSQPEVKQLSPGTSDVVNLTCISSGGYPLATLLWVKGSSGEALCKGQDLTSYSQDHRRMYQLRSQLQLPVQHGPVSCWLRTRGGEVLHSAQFRAVSAHGKPPADTLLGLPGGQPGFSQLSSTVVIISILAWIGL